MLGVFLFTRSQYALAVRPAIGWSAQLSSPFEQEGKPYDHDHVVKILIFNGGGGVAVMTSFTYRLARNEDRTPTAWLTYDDMHDFLRSSGLKSHTDYQTWLYGPGFPLPPGGSEEQAAIVAHIRLASLLRFRIFDIKIEVQDSVGDIHERILHCRAQMRDPAAFTSRARSRHRRQPPLRRTLRDLLHGQSPRRRG